jgi:hypothetical protein
MTEHSEAVSLKEHLESRIHALEKATTVAAAEMNRRLEGMNKFREELDQQTRTFVDKNDFEHRYEVLCGRIVSLETFKEQQTGKANQKDVTNALIIALIGIAVSVCSLVVAIIG